MVGVGGMLSVWSGKCEGWVVINGMRGVCELMGIFIIIVEYECVIVACRSIRQACKNKSIT